MSNATSTSKNSFRYSKSTKDFAVSLYILGGPTLYEFLRLNLPAAIASMSFMVKTVQLLYRKSVMTLVQIRLWDSPSH